MSSPEAHRFDPSPAAGLGATELDMVRERDWLRCERDYDHVHENIGLADYHTSGRKQFRRTSDDIGSFYSASPSASPSSRRGGSARNAANFALLSPAARRRIEEKQRHERESEDFLHLLSPEQKHAHRRPHNADRWYAESGSTLLVKGKAKNKSPQYDFRPGVRDRFYVTRPEPGRASSAPRWVRRPDVDVVRKYRRMPSAGLQRAAYLHEGDERLHVGLDQAFAKSADKRRKYGAGSSLHDHGDSNAINASLGEVEPAQNQGQDVVHTAADDPDPRSDHMFDLINDLGDATAADRSSTGCFMPSMADDPHFKSEVARRITRGRGESPAHRLHRSSSAAAGWHPLLPPENRGRACGAHNTYANSDRMRRVMTSPTDAEIAEYARNPKRKMIESVHFHAVTKARVGSRKDRYDIDAVARKGRVGCERMNEDAMYEQFNDSEYEIGPKSSARSQSLGAVAGGGARAGGGDVVSSGARTYDTGELKKAWRPTEADVREHLEQLREQQLRAEARDDRHVPPRHSRQMAKSLRSPAPDFEYTEARLRGTRERSARGGGGRRGAVPEETDHDDPPRAAQEVLLQPDVAGAAPGGGAGREQCALQDEAVVLADTENPEVPVVVPGADGRGEDLPDRGRQERRSTARSSKMKKKEAKIKNGGTKNIMPMSTASAEERSRRSTVSEQLQRAWQTVAEQRQSALVADERASASKMKASLSGPATGDDASPKESTTAANRHDHLQRGGGGHTADADARHFDASWRQAPRVYPFLEHGFSRARPGTISTSPQPRPPNANYASNHLQHEDTKSSRRLSRSEKNAPSVQHIWHNMAGPGGNPPPKAKIRRGPSSGAPLQSTYQLPTYFLTIAGPFIHNEMRHHRDDLVSTRFCRSDFETEARKIGAGKSDPPFRPGTADHYRQHKRILIARDPLRKNGEDVLTWKSDEKRANFDDMRSGDEYWDL
eukprot:g5963.t1